MEFGTENMVQCMRDWIATHPKGVPGEWEDFERVVYRNVGAKADATYRVFFDQWLRRPGWAKFSLTDVRVEGRTLAAKINWTGQPYSLLTDVMVEYAGGQRQFSQARLSSSDSITVPVQSGKRPVLVSYDPWRR